MSNASVSSFNSATSVAVLKSASSSVMVVFVPLASVTDSVLFSTLMTCQLIGTVRFFSPIYIFSFVAP